MLDDGFDRLLDSLSSLGSDGLSLPAETIGLVLGESKRRGIPWRQAWNTAINNISTPAKGGYIDPDVADEVLEQRALIAEVKPHFRAAYEGRGELRGFSIAAKRAEERLADVDLPTLAKDGPSLMRRAA